LFRNVVNDHARQGQYRGSFQQQVISREVYQVLGMETTPLRVEDRLDGASNFLSWKARVTLGVEGV
jgi:hypothetical protein